MQVCCPYCMNMVQEGENCPRCGKSPASYQTPRHHLPPGTLLNRRYLLGGALGQGSFAITYRAMDMMMNRRVALEEYFPGSSAERDASAGGQVRCRSDQDAFDAGCRSFLEEAQALSELDGIRALAGVYDAFEENGTAYAAVEYLEGRTLRQLVEKQGRIPVKTLWEVAAPVLKGLKKLHRAEALHRDINPNHLIMTRDGSLRLMGYGFARASGSEDIGLYLARGYAPPEQYSGERQGPWSDIYSLSATLYYALTAAEPPISTARAARGQDPLRPPTELGAGLTPAQESALLRGMAYRPGDRWQSVDDLYGALYGETMRGGQWTPPETESGPPDSRPARPEPVIQSDAGHETEFAGADADARRAAPVHVAQLTDLVDRKQDADDGTEFAGRKQDADYATEFAGRKQDADYATEFAGRKQDADYATEFVGRKQDADYATEFAGRKQDADDGTEFVDRSVPREPRRADGGETEFAGGNRSDAPDHATEFVGRRAPAPDSGETEFAGRNAGRADSGETEYVRRIIRDDDDNDTEYVRREIPEGATAFAGSAGGLNGGIGGVRPGGQTAAQQPKKKGLSGGVKAVIAVACVAMMAVGGFLIWRSSQSTGGGASDGTGEAASTTDSTSGSASSTSDNTSGSADETDAEETAESVPTEEELQENFDSYLDKGNFSRAADSARRMNELGYITGETLAEYLTEAGKGALNGEKASDAISLFEEASELGGAEAAYRLAQCYENGIGVERDAETALSYYTSAAELGSAEALNDLGYLTAHGELGAAQDAELARGYYERAAELGSATALNNLGSLYEEGLGVEANAETAFSYYLQGAEAGSALATRNTARCYENGIGTAADAEQAAAWYQTYLDTGTAGEEEAAEISAKLVLLTHPVVNGIAVLGGTEGYPGSGAENLFDDDFETKWCLAFDGEAYVEWMMPGPVRLERFIFQTASDTDENPGRVPSGWILSGKNSMQDEWNAMWTVTDDASIVDESYAVVTFMFGDNVPQYQFYRLEITATRGSTILQLAGIQAEGQGNP